MSPSRSSASPRVPGGRPGKATRARHDDADAASWASSPTVRSRMQTQRARDTTPELAVRRLLHAAGLRYRVDRQPLPELRRRADIVFGPARVAVFIDGCFWHSCPEHGNTPRANRAWWAAKLARNRARDADTDGHLVAAGWLPLRIWEHEPAEAAAERVRRIVEQRSRCWTSQRSDRSR